MSSAIGRQHTHTHQAHAQSCYNKAALTVGGSLFLGMTVVPVIKLIADHSDALCWTATECNHFAIGWAAACSVAVLVADCLEPKRSMNKPHLVIPFGLGVMSGAAVTDLFLSIIQ